MRSLTTDLSLPQAEWGNTYPEMIGYLQDIQLLGTHSLENPCFISLNRTPMLIMRTHFCRLYLNASKGNKTVKLSKTMSCFEVFLTEEKWREIWFNAWLFAQETASLIQYLSCFPVKKYINILKTRSTQENKIYTDITPLSRNVFFIYFFIINVENSLAN